jgi:type II secretory pathway pseudopilin PulG
VVIVIIGVLAGLLLPAILGSRDAARRTQCINNQKQLATAIIHYDSVKQHLPGYTNLIGTHTCGWIPVLLPYLDRRDLWEGDESAGIYGWRSTSTLAPSTTVKVRLGGLVCPNDAGTAVNNPLTYAVNTGIFNTPVSSSTIYPDYPANLVTTNSTGGTDVNVLGVFRDYRSGSTGAISLANVKSTSNTVMLSERFFQTTTSRQWTDTYDDSTPSATIAKQFGFSWPNYQPLSTAAAPSTSDHSILQSMRICTPYSSGGTKYLPPMQSIHPGVILMTFCDGSVKEVSNDVTCASTLYLAVP